MEDLGRVDFEMSTARPHANVPPTTGVFGEVFEADGSRVTSGRVEAHIGGELCGVASTRNRGSFDGYLISVLRTDAAGRCPEGATVDFTVDGRHAGPSIPNAGEHRDPLDLTIG